MLFKTVKLQNSEVIFKYKNRMKMSCN